MIPYRHHFNAQFNVKPHHHNMPTKRTCCVGLCCHLRLKLQLRHHLLGDKGICQRHAWLSDNAADNSKKLCSIIITQASQFQSVRTQRYAVTRTNYGRTPYLTGVCDVLVCVLWLVGVVGYVENAGCILFLHSALKEQRRLANNTAWKGGM